MHWPKKFVEAFLTAFAIKSKSFDYQGTTYLVEDVMSKPIFDAIAYDIQNGLCKIVVQ